MSLLADEDSCSVELIEGKTLASVNISKYLKPNRWPKNGPLALNGVLLVAQKWPVGKQGVKHVTTEQENVFIVFNFVSLI